MYRELKIAVISDTTYRASLPDDPMCMSYYGSEPYHAVLADALAKRGHEVHWFAPVGSSKIGIFHPLLLTFGTYFDHDTIEEVTLGNENNEFLASMDFIIDMSAAARTIEELYWYHDFRHFCCYRNGYTGHHVPRTARIHRNLVVPSKQNQALFKKAGVESRVAYYGIPDFYSPGFDESHEMVGWFDKYELHPDDYYLFSHRPTPDKGIDIIIKLVKRFPKETFVIAGSAPVAEHMMHLAALKTAKEIAKLDNLKFVPIPINHRHHYYKRELMRNAKAMLSPLGPNYYEGFGLANAECIACGTPVICSDSESNRELWREEIDALCVDGYRGFEMAIKHFDNYDFKPENRYKVEDYAKRYEQIAAEILMGA